MNEIDKLRILIPHWIIHNNDHADEFRIWAVLADDAAPDILAAVEHMAQVNEALETALKKLGGALEYHHKQ